MEFHDIKIGRIVDETSDTKVFHLLIPRDIKSHFVFLPGQYLTISAEILGQEVRRSYSICTTPLHEDIGVGVKMLDGGKMSSYLHQQKEGASLKVAAPEGKFVVKTDQDAKLQYLFVAAGSGITPIMSMIETIVEEEPLSICHLLYGSKHEDAIIFKNKLDSLQQKYEGQLFVSHILSQPKLSKPSGVKGWFSKGKADWQGLVGRISSGMMLSYITENRLNQNLLKAYICGPGDMIERCETALIEAGVPKNHVHREFFSAPKPNAPIAPVALGGLSQVTVHLNGETFTYENSLDKTILESLVNLKKDPPYSCTSGACSSCMAKVTKGSVAMEVHYALEDDEVEAGFILTCQAKPTSSEVAISFDV